MSISKWLLSEEDQKDLEEGTAYITAYQDFCREGWKKGNDELVFALGLGGETGEVLEILKKARRDEKPVDIEHLKEELGDVCWYIANLCTSYGIRLRDVLKENEQKLRKRYSIKEPSAIAENPDVKQN